MVTFTFFGIELAEGVGEDDLEVVFVSALLKNISVSIPFITKDNDVHQLTHRAQQLKLHGWHLASSWPWQPQLRQPLLRQ